MLYIHIRIELLIFQEPVVILWTHRVPSKHPSIFDVIAVIWNISFVRRDDSEDLGPSWCLWYGQISLWVTPKGPRLILRLSKGLCIREYKNKNLTKSSGSKLKSDPWEIPPKWVWVTPFGPNLSFRLSEGLCIRKYKNTSLPKNSDPFKTTLKCVRVTSSYEPRHISL